MIKMIVLDLDGTLLTDDKILTEYTIETLKKISEKRIMITIATGRAYELTKPYAEALNIKIPLILNNGALIKHHNPESIVFKNELPYPVVEQFLNVAEALNIGYTFYAEDGFHTNDPKRTRFYQEWNETHRDSAIDLHIDPSGEDLQTKPFYKMLLVIENPNTIIEMYERFKDSEDFHVTQSLDQFFDILPKNTNKGTALKRLMDSYNLKPENVLVFGDNYNDLEMFEVAMHSVAMPNASEVLKNKAKSIALEDNNNEGVAKTLRRFLEENIL